MKDACTKSVSNGSCDRWKRPFSEAFPELENSEWVPASLTFGESVEVLKGMEELTQEGQLSISGASVPISKRKLLVLVAVVLALQGYLLFAIRMVINMVQEVSVGSAGDTVAWIALFDDNLLRFAWRVSLSLPPMSILASIIWTPDINIVGAEAASEFIKMLPQVLCVLISAAVSYVTLRCWSRL